MPVGEDAGFFPKGADQPSIAFEVYHADFAPIGRPRFFWESFFRKSYGIASIAVLAHLSVIRNIKNTSNSDNTQYSKAVDFQQSAELVPWLVLCTRLVWQSYNLLHQCNKLSVFQSLLHRIIQSAWLYSRFSHGDYGQWTEGCLLSSTGGFLVHQPLFIMCATRRRLRSMRVLRALRSPFWARVR